MRTALAFALILGLAACGDKPKLAPLAEAAPRTEVISIEAPKPDANKALALRVQRAFEEAKLPGIDVVASEGAVTLWGTTVNAAERSRAAALAAGVEGVKSVENRLEIVAGS